MRLPVSLLVGLVPLALSATAPGQVAWTRQNVRVAPGPRGDLAMAWDGTGALLYGGWDGSNDLADTWRFAAGKWTQLKPATSLGKRSSQRMVFDSGRKRVVLFGGWDGAGPASDTWEWNGSTWQKITTKNAPPARFSHAMAYDPVRGRTVLFGGACGRSCRLGDTWEDDGRDWTRRTPAASPSARFSSAMVWDGARRTIMLYGGSGAVGRLGDTWLYDGSGWKSLTPSPAPGPRSTHAMEHDALRGRVVLFGGFDGATYVGSTWEWDGRTWQRRQPAASPAGRGFAAFAYDHGAGHTVLFGGSASGRFGDTWTYQTTAVATQAGFGAGCRGSGGVPQLTPEAGALPWLGETFAMTLSGLPTRANVAVIAFGLSRTRWANVSLPLDLGPLGAPGCTLLVAIDAALAVPALGGRGRWPLQIPAVPALTGARFYEQILVPDPSNRLGLVASNAGSSRIGAK